MVDSDDAEFDYLQSPRAIRERCAAIFERARASKLEHFSLDEDRLSDVVTRVIEVTRLNYPDFSQIPYHGRYRHFDAGGVPRLRRFDERIAELSADEKLATRFELVIVSVLLDAGAGEQFRYLGADGASYTRSEGLAVASFELYAAGALGGKEGAPRADAEHLSRFSAHALASAFQVTADNPLTGLPGRAALFRRLAEVMLSSPDYFGATSARLGNLGPHLVQKASSGHLPARTILSAVLGALGPIWQGRPTLAGRSLGDVWQHSELGYVPFHKLSQWLSYSLFEPLEAAGIVIDAAYELTGLAEYRNGGLFMDAGVLQLRDPAARAALHAIDSDLVIEWRALTVALLDRTAELVRARLGLSEAELPLARILEGGTWRAGRAIALERRSGGGPPLRIDSDGTVF